MKYTHTSVMAVEALNYLAPRPGGVYVDATVGGGGHSERILENLKEGSLIGLDADAQAVKESGERLKRFKNAKLFQANFRNLAGVLEEAGIRQVDGILMDLGVSSHHLDEAERGFSFMKEGPLNMRMEQTGGRSAEELVNTLKEEELARIFRECGEERWAKRIAKKICEARVDRKITTTKELAEIIEKSVPRKFWPKKIHPATRVFQALRIAVNDELNALEEGLETGIAALKSGGRICVISYHSLEDRIVKRTFLKLSGKCQCPPRIPECRCGSEKLLRIITPKPVLPGAEEINKNPRARSAKLRAAERIGREN